MPSLAEPASPHDPPAQARVNASSRAAAGCGGPFSTDPRSVPRHFAGALAAPGRCWPSCRWRAMFALARFCMCVRRARSWAVTVPSARARFAARFTALCRSSRRRVSRRVNWPEATPWSMRRSWFAWRRSMRDAEAAAAGAGACAIAPSEGAASVSRASIRFDIVFSLWVDEARREARRKVQVAHLERGRWVARRQGGRVRRRKELRSRRPAPLGSRGTERLSGGACRQAAAGLAGRRQAAPAHQANRGS